MKKTQTFAVYSKSLDEVVPVKLDGLCDAGEEITELCFHPRFYRGCNQLAIVTVLRNGIQST